MHLIEIDIEGDETFSYWAPNKPGDLWFHVEQLPGEYVVRNRGATWKLFELDCGLFEGTLAQLAAHVATLEF